VQREFELKLDNGKIVTWVGENGEDASRRYADCKGDAVVAWRHPRYELVIGVDPSRIIG
jgi:hypothetical protein